MLIEFNALHFEPTPQGNLVCLVADVSVEEAVALIKQLADKIAANALPPNPDPVLVFKNHGVIDWETGSEAFTPATYGLLKAMWKLPKNDRSVTKARIAGEVLENDDAGDSYIKMTVKRAREEVEKSGFPYEIETQRGVGYRLRSV